MKKNKFQFRPKVSKSWLSNFSANILGVIVGIALTFGISNYVQYCSEQKELREMMSLIKRELNDNKTWIEQTAGFYREDVHSYMMVLEAGNWDKIPQDTIGKIIDHLKTNYLSYTSSNIWNIFQNSGMVHKLHNAELVSYISEAYYWIEHLNNDRNEYLKLKTKLIDVYEDEFEEQPHQYLEAIMNNKESKRFLEETVKFHRHDFSAFSEKVIPIIDYIIFSVENYDNPEKLAIDYETFNEMQENNQ